MTCQRITSFQTRSGQPAGNGRPRASQSSTLKKPSSSDGGFFYRPTPRPVPTPRLKHPRPTPRRLRWGYPVRPAPPHALPFTTGLPVQRGYGTTGLSCSFLPRAPRVGRLVPSEVEARQTCAKRIGLPLRVRPMAPPRPPTNSRLSPRPAVHSAGILSHAPSFTVGLSCSPRQPTPAPTNQLSRRTTPRNHPAPQTTSVPPTPAPRRSRRGYLARASLPAPRCLRRGYRYSGVTGTAGLSCSARLFSWLASFLCARGGAGFTAASKLSVIFSSA